jgi:steroid delta-isomerase-like uncharacterized protein
MSTEQHKVIFRRATEEVWNNGNVAAVEVFFAPDFVNHNPFGGTSPDQAGMREAVQLLHTALPDFHSTIEDMIAEGDTVVARMTLRGTHLGQLLGIPPSGAPIVMTTISIVRITNGQIVERWNISDTLGLVRQIGVVIKLAYPPGIS